MTAHLLQRVSALLISYAGKNRLLLLSAVILPLLAACFTINITDPVQYHFVGRLAMTQEADPADPNSKADSLSAHYELGGNASQGQLWIYTPIGTTIARVVWQPGAAQVETSEETYRFSSLDELTIAYFQRSLPVAALFDWLRGESTEKDIPGWTVDLERAKEGVLKAERTSPLPLVKLRVIVDKDLSKDPQPKEAVADGLTL